MNYKYVLLLLLLAGLFSCQGNDTASEKGITGIVESGNSDTTGNQGAKIVFEEDLHNFGNVIQGERVSYSFKFTNKGNQDLVISMARGSCGCTVPTYPKKPIKPGEAGKIDVEFDSENLMGINQKTVTLLTNSRPYGIYTLTIQSSVMPVTTNN